MKQTVLLVLLFSLGGILQGCKKDTPNVPPLVSVTAPDFQKSYKLNHKIPVKYSVYDADGLSKVAWAITYGRYGTLIYADSLTSLSSNSLDVDSGFTIQSLYGGVDSVTCFFTVAATDATGESKSVSVRFSVK